MSPRVLGWVAVATLGLASPAKAEPPDRAACVAAFGDAQDRRGEGELLASREAMLVCAQASCPDVVEKKCNEWLGELEDEIPSVVVVLPPAVSADGLTVLVDGVEQPDALAGRPIELDPGPHQVEHRRDGVSLGVVPVVLGQGERNKRVELAVPPPEPVPEPPPTTMLAPPPPPDDGLSPLVWLGGGVAVAGVLVGAITGGMALSRASDLDAQCPGGRCPEEVRDDFDEGQTLSHVSTVGFVVAGVGAVLATVGIVLSVGDEETATVRLGPTGVRGSF